MTHLRSGSLYQSRDWITRGPYTTVEHWRHEVDRSDQPSRDRDDHDGETQPKRTGSASRPCRATTRNDSKTSSPSGEVSATSRRRCGRQRNAAPDWLAGPQQRRRRGDHHVRDFSCGWPGFDRRKLSLDRHSVGRGCDFIESRQDTVDRPHAEGRGSRNKQDQLIP